MKFNLLILVSSLYLVACSSAPQKPKYKSGFLNDYANFKVNPNEQNSFYKKHANFNVTEFKNYKTIALSPIEIWLPNDKKAVENAMRIEDKSKQQALTFYFQ